MITKLSFKGRIAALLCTALAGMLLLTVLAVYKLGNAIDDGRRAQLVAAVESAHSIVAAYQAQAAAGKMTVPQAQAAATEALRGSRFGKDDYFYIWTLDGAGVMHPFKPEWVGQNMIGKVKDGGGVDVVAALVAGAKASRTGYAFVMTNFPRPGSTVPQPKLQYVARVPGWDWLVGAGLYMDDVHEQVIAEIKAAALVALLLLAVIGGVGFAVSRSVVRQIGGDPADAMAAMHEVARGNLSVELGRPPAGSLLAELASMVASLSGSVGQVREATDGIVTASSQIASGGQDLSSRTEQNAASLQETAASMKQLAITVAQTSSSALTANQLAQDASASAVQGGEVVREVVATMGGISESSRRIGDIIGVIDGIAFQTNILALNAAVEAARAGEQGRGFAVVASEVRNLAQRSAEAAKEIKSLIGQSVERVESGSAQVARAGDAMQAIVQNVERVQRIIAEITTASGEQSAGIGQVNTAVAELDRSTQQNAALVEESAAAAESLQSQARRLNESMQYFRLAGAAA
ncbi:MAG: methyl-accepting chemotaxis protein [Ramlibacter sp.]